MGNRATVLLDLQREDGNLVQTDLAFVNYLSGIAHLLHDEFGKISLQFQKGDRGPYCISAEFRWNGIPLVQARHVSPKNSLNEKSFHLLVRQLSPRGRVGGQILKHPFRDLGKTSKTKVTTELVRELFLALHQVMIDDRNKLVGNIALVEKALPKGSA